MRIIFLFLYLYNFAFFFAPRQIRSAVILSICLIIYHLIKTKGRIKAPKLLINPLIVYIYLLGISTIVMLLNQSYDYSFIILYCINILFLIGGFLLYYYFYSSDSILSFLNEIFLVIFIQSVFVLSMTLMPNLGDYIRFLINNKSWVDEMHLTSLAATPFRGNGVSGSVLWDFGVQQSIGLILCSYLIYTSNKKTIYYFIAYFTILFSVLVTGRSGLLGLATSLLFFIYKGKDLYSAKKHNIKIKIALIFLFISPLIFYNINLSKFENILRFGFEFFYNLEEKGEFSSDSTDALFTNHLTLSHNINLLFGDGKYTNDINNKDLAYGDTDSGFLRHLYYYGIFSCILYILIFYLFYKIINSIPKSKYKLRLIYTSIMLFYIIIHIKGDFLLASYQNMNFLFISYFFFTKDKQLVN